MLPAVRLSPPSRPTFTSLVSLTGLTGLAVLAGCASSEHVPNVRPTASASALAADASPALVAAQTTALRRPRLRQPPHPPAPRPRPLPPRSPRPAAAPNGHEQMVAWLKERVPAGDEVTDAADGIRVLHTVARGEIPATLAHAYIGLSDVYFEDAFTTEIAKSARKDGGFRPGNKLRVPHLVSAPFKSANDERIGHTRGQCRQGALTSAVRHYTKPMFLFILDQMGEAPASTRSSSISAKGLRRPRQRGPNCCPLAIETGRREGAANPTPIFGA